MNHELGGIDDTVGRYATVPVETGEFWYALDQADDLRDAYAFIRERIESYRNAGWPIPEKLHRREREIMIEFMAQSQGR